MKRKILRAFVLLAAVCAASAVSARTHYINSAVNFANLLNGQKVNNYALADGDTINIYGSFTMSSSSTVSKRCTLTTTSGRTLTIPAACTLTFATDVTVTNLTVSGNSATRTTAALSVSDGVTTFAAGAALKDVFCNAAGVSPVTVGAAGAFALTGGTITNCRNTAGDGGAIRSAGTLAMSGGSITSCSASGRGGAVYVGDGLFELSGGTISGNAVTGADSDGGAIYLEDGTLGVRGAPVVANNTLNGAANNIGATDGARIWQLGDLDPGAQIGVSFPTAEEADGVWFATRFSADLEGFGAFTYDGDTSGTVIVQTNDAELVWNDTAVCRVGAVKYASLSAAVAAAVDGATVEILRDITLDGAMALDKNVTLTSAPGGIRTISRGAANAAFTVSAGVTLADIVIDGAGAEATAAMFTVADGASLALTDGAVIRNCRNAEDGGGAVLASGRVDISGTAAVTNNTAGGAASDIRPTSPSLVRLAGDFSGSAGVKWPASGAKDDALGTPFGIASGADVAGAERLFWNGDGSVVGELDGTNLVWGLDYVCRIGTVRYASLADAMAAAEDGAVIELIKDVTLDESLTIGKNVTITSVPGGVHTISRGAADAAFTIAADVALAGVVVDGANVEATAAMFTVAAGASLAVGDGAVIRNCRNASGPGGAILAAGAVHVSGSATVTGNTAAGRESNLVPLSSTCLDLVGDFTGSIGVTWPTNVTGRAIGGTPFGSAGAFSGADNFFLDDWPAVTGTTVAETGRLVWPTPAEDRIVVNGGAVTFNGAASATTLPDGDVVLVFSDPATAGRFTLPTNAKARILLVGGGGSGGSVGLDVDRGAAGGGGAGGVVERETILEGGEYQVVVGAGGMRVQTVVQSWVGDDGENSLLLSGERNVAVAKGGGGGGTVKVSGSGTPGGSGGGGSWYGEFLAGGTATDGQGWAGGTPNDMNIGGGGGGGAKTSVGHGGANGVAGVGRTSDITGAEILYAQGGRGGDRTDAAYAPQDGAGPGFGGDGAASGYGGKGADGLVIVRIHKLFDYTLVERPAFTDSFFWEDGANCIAFDAGTLNDDQRAAIAWIDGVTNAVCSVTDGGAVTNGLGAYSFTLRLNDEYRWDDGADGSGAPYTCFWRVKDPDTVGNASVEVTKTVSWYEGTNATIDITVHSTPEQRKFVPNVLFLGGLCGAHGLSEEVIETAINTVTDIGNIDYYLFNNVTSTTAVAARYQGSLLKGEKTTWTDSLVSHNHSPLYGFYEYLARAIDSGKTYDYVIFSFDRSLVATFFPATHPREAEIVDYIRAFYERGAVIWLVDNQPPDDDTHNIVQTPWYPSQLICMTNNGYTWSSLYYWEYTWGTRKGNRSNSLTASYNGLNAMLGLFSPANYPFSRSVYDANYIASSSAVTAARVAATAGAVNENQVVYDDAESVADIISRVIKPMRATIALKDTVNVDPAGLAIRSAAATWTTNEATMGWVEMTPAELVWTDTGVDIALSNIWTEAWIRLAIDVTDYGGFLSSVGAAYNERTGEWEKDPNDGPAVVTMSPESGPEILAEDDAATAVAWFFEAFKITGEVTHGEGEFVLNGFVTNIVSVGQGTSPEIVFRGAPGWVLDYLEVDGEAKPCDHTTFKWLFENIGADHDIKVGFREILAEPYPETGPYEHLCDGGAYGCELVSGPTFAEGLEGLEWYPVYSMESNGVYTADGGQIDVVRDENGNVVSTNVYVRICVQQPGYEDGVVLDRWTGVDEVTILPRPLEITLDNQVQTSSSRIPTSEFTYYPVVDSLMEGDRIEVTYAVDYPGAGGTAPITATVRVFDAEGRDVTGNYALTVNPGVYFYPEPEDCAAEATGVVKYYDAAASAIAVTVLNPTSTPTADEIRTKYGYYSVSDVTANGPTVLYSVDGGVTYSAENPAFTDVGEYTVHYKVSYSYSFRYRRNQYYWGQTQSATVTYDDFVSSAKVIIKPRTVVVTAGSAEKLYDGTALVQPAYTVSARDDAAGVGFAGTDGFASLNMTAASTITNPGTTANVPDAANATFTPSTKLSNYAIEYVDGSLTVTRNQLSATASSIEKTYDGEPSDPVQVVVVDSQGNPLPPGTYTIRYASDPWATEWSLTPPEPPTDAGEYPVFFQVDGGDGYGAASGYAVITVKPRRVALQAGSATQDYTGDPLTSSEFTVLPGEGDDYGFVAGEGITSVVMTEDSTITKPGTVPNSIDTARISSWTFAAGTKPQNYRFETEDGTLTVNWRKTIEVVGPGVLTWQDIIEADGAAAEDMFFTVAVDGGEPVKVHAGDMADWAAETLVFGGETNLTHTVVIVFENVCGMEATADVRDIVWTPYDVSIEGAVKDSPAGTDYTVTNLGTAPTNATSGVTLINGEGAVTVGEVDEAGNQTGSTVNPADGATDETAGTEDYWYVLPDPRGGTNTVAGTPPTLSPGEEVSFTVSGLVGPGTLTWDDFLVDAASGEGVLPATFTVTIDGGDPITIHTGGMDGWASESIVFGGETNIEHTVTITFVNNTSEAVSDMAQGYVDNIVWTPYDTDIKPVVTAADSLAFGLENLGTDPGAENEGATLLNGEAVSTTSTLDENGAQATSVVGQDGAVSGSSTGTEDYWYVVRDPDSAEHPDFAQTAPTLSAGESASFTVTGLSGPAKVSWDMVIDDGVPSSGKTNSILEVVVTQRIANEDGTVTTNVVTHTYSADDIMTWTHGYLPLGGEVGCDYDLEFIYTNNSDGDGVCSIDNIKWIQPDINVAPELNDGDPNQPDEGSAYEGDVSDPDDPHYAGYATGNDSLNPWEVVGDPQGTDDKVAQTPDSLAPGESTTLTFTVEGDGEFRWSSLVDDGTPGGTPAVVTIVVDGVTNQVYTTEEDWTDHVIHVTDAPGQDGASHVIEIVFTNDGGAGDSTMFVDDVSWTPSATAEETYGIVVNTEPPSQNVEEIKKTIVISNDASSGWMPVYSNDTVVALRSADGTEGGGGLDSTLTLEAVGTGEIAIGRITIPERDGDENSDGGLLVITVDGVEYVIPPEPDETVSYNIFTTNGVTTIENLVIKVYGDSEDVHTIVINYTRDADDPEGNTAAVIEDITWKTYGQTDDGGTSWLDDEGVALMIIDHEDPGDGWVYLAFKPQLKVEQELVSWVTRSANNNKIKVKYGRTRAECDACAPVTAQLSDKPGHEVRPVKVWIKVPLNGIVQPVGYWRVWIAESAIAYVDDDDPMPGLLTAPDSGSGIPASESDGGARSVNVFGIVRVESVMTNTIIAVPWTWYSAEEQKATHIPATKLVKTTNLSEGDRLMQYRLDDEDGEHYECWAVEDGEWTPMVTATSNAVYNAVSGPDGAVSVRGYGLWLVRQRPVDENGDAIPFYLYGQSVTNQVVSTARGGEITVPTYTMLGNPYCEPVRINDLAFRGEIGTEDRLIVPSGANASKYLQYKAGKGWRWVEVKIINGAPKNTYDYDVVVPAGTGFWYVRRTAGDLNIEWTMPQ